MRRKVDVLPVMHEVLSHPAIYQGGCSFKSHANFCTCGACTVPKGTLRHEDNCKEGGFDFQLATCPFPWRTEAEHVTHPGGLPRAALEGAVLSLLL